ncbi:LTXXQ motif family protein [Rhizobiales bacterium GAS191]|jgi:hypothetical protein|nr:LTXXQ motif family protein [Rhizobiales bacterium GAS113]SEE23716.1 LTXXQ motif family protein [Rhizobiales bacterium GAS188]SEE33714.1 LTXXQ motif family protein [Rhizobiales bacterium GAS191]
MNRTVMSAAALALAGAGAFAFAQTQSPFADSPAAPAVSTIAMAGMRASAEDRAVLLDARLGAIKAALKLTSDQEKLWVPVESFIRKSATLQDQRIQEMRERVAQMRDGAQPSFDPIAKLRKRADRMTVEAGRMREFADAAAPLYASLSEDQKRRAFLLHRARGDVLGLGGSAMRGDDLSGFGDMGRLGKHLGRSLEMLDWRG